MSPAPPWTEPPQTRNAEGGARRIGVEIEFAGVAVPPAADAVVALFGGTPRWEGAHRAHVEGTRFGDFRVEIDMNLAHRILETETERTLRDAVVDLSSAVIPVEIVCPPIPWHAAHALDDLCSLLRRMGAEGTREGLFYAFGVQLNPEPPSLAIADLLETLRAFFLLRDWLRREIDVDNFRRLWQFEQPFPEGYGRLVLAPGYLPDLAEFIDDYIDWNPTRDRELDLLPLLCFLDRDRVRGAMPDEKINARPTWHYRLPNSDIGAPGWSIGTEWARWVKVERLAAQPELMAEWAGLWLDNAAQLLPHSWEPEAVALAGKL